MKSNEFLDRVGGFNAAFTRSDAEQRAMKLRDALLIPRGPRGPHAPHLEPVHMARLLIGLTASETAPKAVDAVIEYAKMSAIGERWFPGAEDFETALTAIFSDIKLTLQVKELIVCRSWPEASIIMTDGSRFTFSTLDPPVYEKQLCRIDYSVSWHFFHTIKCAVDSDETRWGLGLKTNEDVEAYRQFILQANKIGNEQGEDAAQAWRKENPFNGKGQDQ